MDRRRRELARYAVNAGSIECMAYGTPSGRNKPRHKLRGGSFCRHEIDREAAAAMEGKELGGCRGTALDT